MSTLIDMIKAAESGNQDDNAIDRLLEANKDQIEQLDALLDEATVDDLGRVFNAVNICIANISHRTRDASLRKRLIKLLRQALHIIKPLIDQTDPGDLNSLFQLSASLHFNRATTVALGRVRKAKQEEEHRQAVEATDGDVEELEKIRAEKSKQGPEDGAEQDLDGESLEFSEDDLDASIDKGESS